MKLHLSTLPLHSERVTLCVRVWIEINESIEKSNWDTVTLCVRVWIEIVDLLMNLWKNLVTLCVRVWIEIYKRTE